MTQKKAPTETWREHAACRGQTDLFFRNCKNTDSARMYGPAKAICDTCPALEPCREWALSEWMPHGFVGGLSPRQREAIRRQRRRQAA